MKFKIVTLAICLGITGCAPSTNGVSTTAGIQVFYSEKTASVCFTYVTSSSTGNISCLPASLVKTTNLQPNIWQDA